MRKPKRLTALYSTSVRLRVEQEEALRAEAFRRKVSMSGLVGEIIDEWMLFRKPAGVHGMNTREKVQ